jgi:predicted GTPase
VQIPVKIIDSPSANEASIPSVKVQIETILSESDILIYVLDVSQLGSNDEERLLLSILNTAPCILRAISERGFFIINKIDKARAEGENDSNLIDYVSKFLERIIVDGKPMKIPKQRIIAASAEQYFLARAYQRTGHVDNMSEKDKYLLLQTLFGCTAEAVVDNPDAYLAKIQERVERILESSNGQYVRDLLLQFLEGNSLSAFLNSMLDKMKNGLQKSLGSLLRRQVTSQLSHDQLRSKLNEIEKVLYETANSGKMEKLVSIIERTNQELINLENSWYAAMINDPFAVKGSMDVSVFSAEFDLQSSAAASAKDIAQHYCTSWLVEFLNSKNTLEHKLNSEISSTTSELVVEFRGLMDTIARTFMKGLNMTGLDADAFKLALQKTVRIESSTDTFVKIDITNVDDAIASRAKVVSYEETESYIAEETYVDVEYRTRHHERWTSGILGRKTGWTSQEPYQVTRVRQVLKQHAVLRTRTENKFIVTAETIKNIVSKKCKALIDEIHLDLSRNINTTFVKIVADLGDNVSTKVTAFMDDLKKDLVRNQQGEETKKLELQYLEKYIAEMKAIINNIHRLQMDISTRIEESTLKHYNSNEGQSFQGQHLHSLFRTIALHKKQNSTIDVTPNLPMKLLESWSKSKSPSDMEILEKRFQTDSMNFDQNAILRILDYFQSLPVIQISIAGLSKAGKTTLLNAVLESPIAVSGVLPETARLLHIQDCDFADSDLEAQLLYRNPVTGQKMTIATNPESISTFLKESNQRNRAEKLQAPQSQFSAGFVEEYSTKPLTLVHPIPWLPLLLRSAPLQFTDTPGFNEAFLKSLVQEEMRKAIDTSSAVIYVMDGTRLEQEDESELIGHLHGWISRSLEKHSAASASATNTGTSTRSHREEMIPFFQKVFQLKDDYFYEALTIPLIVVVNKLDQWVMRQPKNTSSETLHTRAYFWIIQQFRVAFQQSKPDITMEEITRLFPKNQLVLFSASQALVKSVVSSQVCNYSVEQERLISGRTLASVTSTICGVMTDNFEGKSCDECEQDLLRICEDLGKTSCLNEFQEALKKLIVSLMVPKFI